MENEHTQHYDNRLRHLSSKGKLKLGANCSNISINTVEWGDFAGVKWSHSRTVYYMVHAYDPKMILLNDS